MTRPVSPVSFLGISPVLVPKELSYVFKNALLFRTMTVVRIRTTAQMHARIMITLAMIRAMPLEERPAFFVPF